MTRVLVAIDETEQSKQVARTAHRLFGESADYLAINVAADPVMWVMPDVAWGGVWTYPWSEGEYSADAARQESHAAEVADEAAASAGLRAEAVGEIGDPVAAILDAAHQHEVDVIVVGSHDKGWWRRLLDGSVSESLVRMSDTPVLVVKETAKPTE
jgi:nucleotide-binding universal stress UspA family protein